jgi:hypothetical protein
VLILLYKDLFYVEMMRVQRLESGMSWVRITDGANPMFGKNSELSRVLP